MRRKDIPSVDGRRKRRQPEFRSAAQAGYYSRHRTVRMAIRFGFVSFTSKGKENV